MEKTEIKIINSKEKNRDKCTEQQKTYKMANLNPNKLVIISSTQSK